MKHFIKILLLVLIVNLADYSKSMACLTYTWTGASSSDWGDSGNWEDDFGGNGVPWIFDYAVIDKSQYGTAPDPILSSSENNPLQVILSNSASLTLNNDFGTNQITTTGVGNQLIVNGGVTLSANNLVLSADNAEISISGNGDIDIGASIYFQNNNTSLTNNLTGELDIGDDVVFEANNALLINNGTISITDDIRTTGATRDGNTVINNVGAVLNIGDRINFQSADGVFQNAGTINQTGNFVNISTNCSFINLSTGVWSWTYTGTPHSNLAGALTAGGTMIYAGTGAQQIQPVIYENVIISGSGTKQLQGNTTVNGTLTLSAGYVALNDADLTIGNNGSIANASSSRFIITNGNGRLSQNNIGSGGKAGDILFPVGRSSSSYTPLTLNNSAGTADNFAVRLVSAIYDNGYSGTVQTANAVNKTWFIDEEVAGGSDVSLTLQWGVSDQLSGFSPLNVRLIHYDGSQWERMAEGAASGTGPYTMSASGITSFSPFGIEGEDGVLPVELVSFNAALQSEAVLLEWATASELNNDFFTIEKTTDLENFQEVGTVKGKGTTEERNDYKFFDLNPSQGVFYYRLKQTDFDGTFTYSDIEKVVNTASGSAEANLNIYPVPNKGEFIKLMAHGMASDGKRSVTVMNVQGQIIYEGPVLISNNEEITLNFDQKLPQGIYTVRVQGSEPMVKQFTVN
ncbi:hypothetical protein C900_03132 [Fulvivirga imtechensis AK7]|uniref:Secretion system C-terminal sorting domain-containing protein n=1 Tax=Fulvivirga imtechensis AK7 TaxID=1237149 RepID=L8JUN5_9BACT|nr:T9SS type A sorting domain-containing protein [Fulvivirga imtechensis]ELR71002.1 hypothetical protein C900_03132 [Fulvivirga imtechensis AK7]